MQETKVMVIDDEENIRLGIVEGIDWNSYEIEIVCQAANGRDALILAKKHMPEIILLDINMPLMNGLEFSRKVKEFLPNSFLIVLTGYDEFEYAKESIQLGVSDYLLKPISPADLIAAVLKARDKVIAGAQHEKFIDDLKQEIRQNLPLLREKLISDILHDSFLEYKIESKLQYLDINFPADKFAALTLEIDDFYKIAQKSDEMDRQLTMFAVKKIADETMNENQWGLSLISNDGFLEALICLAPSTHYNLKDILNNTAESIRKNIERYLNFTVSIGIGNIYSGLSQVSCSYKEAYNSLKYTPFRGNNKIYDISYLNLSSPFLVNYPFEKEIVMINNLKACNGKAMDSLEDIFSEIEAYEDSVHLLGYFKTFSYQLLLAVLKLLISLDINHENIKIKYDYLFNNSSLIKDISYLKEELRDLLNECQDYIIKSKGVSYRKEIGNVKNYINENYSRDIALKEISASVFMNPNYLCTLFKSEVGETINNYIIKVRMEKAMGLLQRTELKIFEIADMVGYSNTNYFSYAFKKYTGIPPNEYKSIGVNNLDK
ncbi:MAG TPA: response regulator [Ruminiclostridium sp.]